MTVVGSTEYVYRANFVRTLYDGQIELFVDLGFKMWIHWYFTVVTTDEVSEEARLEILDNLHNAEEILIKTHKDGEGLYSAEVNYRIGREWRNITAEMHDWATVNA